MNLREYIDFNTNVSSEMFVSLISTLLERVPCSSYVLKTKRDFKTQEFIRNQKSLKQAKPDQDEDALVAKAEEMCMSPVRAVATPKILQN